MRHAAYVHRAHPHWAYTAAAWIFAALAVVFATGLFAVLVHRADCL